MDARIAVIGAGYVGLPLAVAFAEAGHAVLCVEPDAPRVARINAGDSYTIPPGHDAWVEGDEPCVAIEVMSAEQYGKPAQG